MINRIFYILLFGALFIIPNLSEAQQKNLSVKLVDEKTAEPIIGAHYTYNNQLGISDKSGLISFTLEDSGKLNLSHISYGNWSLDANELKSVISEGVIYRAEEAYSLQPITVIAIHDKIEEKETVNLDYKDKLSHDAGAVLNQTPVISSIRKSGSYGFDPVLRGFKYDQLNVVIDGAQCAVAACPNRMDPPTSQVAPNMMENVEIFKGPHSLRYGSSFGGTINFVPTAPRFSTQNDVYGRLSGSTESNGGIFRSEGLIGYSGEYYDLGIFGSLSKGSDYNDGDDNEVASAFQRASFGLNLGVKLSKNQHIGLSATRNIAEDVDFPALPMDLISDKTTLVNLTHTVDIQKQNLKSWKTTIYGTFVDHLMNNYRKILDPRMVNAKTDAETFSYGGRTESNWLFSRGRLFTGIDLRVEKADGIRTREFVMGPNMGKILQDNVWNGGQISKTGIFGEYHHLFSAFKMIFSGRLEYNNATATDLNEKFELRNSDTDITEVNPSISIGGLKNINEKITIGLWLGRAQRSAGLTERYINSFPVGIDPYDMLGNPSLNPEINNQLDLTLNYKSSSTILDIGLFVSILNDYISSSIDTSLSPTMPSSPGVRRFQNIDDALMTGFEISWAQGITDNLQHLLTVAYTYGKDRVKNDPLPEIAPLDLRYKLMGSYFNGKLKPEVSLRHVLKQSRISNIFGESKTPSFSLVDLSIRYQYNRVVGAALGVQNLLDGVYYEHLSRSVKGTSDAIFAPGRNIYFSLIIDVM